MSNLLVAFFKTWTPGNIMEKAQHFLKTDFPLVQNALLFAENATSGSVNKVKQN